MAVNIETFKNPKVLLLAGGAVVGGIYLASKMRPKTSDAPVEVPITTQSVIATGQLQREDELSRELAEAQQKQDDLIKRQDAERKSLEDKLANLTSTSRDERASFQSTLANALAALTARFEPQIAAQNELIRRLEEQLKKAQETPQAQPIVTNPQPGGGLSGTPNTGPGTNPQQPSTGGPRGGMGTPQPQQPSAPIVVVKKYPGLPDNYVLNCAGKPTALRFSTFDAAVADQRKKNIKSATFLARNMVTIAIAGGTSPWLIGWDVAMPGDPRRAQLNNSRVYWGLMPLTEEQMTELSNHMRSLWPFNTMAEPQRTNTFNNLNAYARPLWERWNLPFQCSGSTPRY